MFIMIDVYFNNHSRLKTVQWEMFGFNTVQLHSPYTVMNIDIRTNVIL